MTIQRDRYVDEWMGKLDGYVYDGWKDRWTDRQTNGWLDGWMNM